MSTTTLSRLGLIVLVLAMWAVPTERAAAKAKPKPVVGATLETIQLSSCPQQELCITGTGTGHFEGIGDVTIVATGSGSGGMSFAYREDLVLTTLSGDKVLVHVQGYEVSQEYAYYVYQPHLTYKVTGGTGSFSKAKGSGTISGRSYSANGTPHATLIRVWRGTWRPHG